VGIARGVLRKDPKPRWVQVPSEVDDRGGDGLHAYRPRQRATNEVLVHEHVVEENVHVVEGDVIDAMRKRGYGEVVGSEARGGCKLGAAPLRSGRLQRESRMRA
jgi:hypothetical protein